MFGRVLGYLIIGDLDLQQSELVSGLPDKRRKCGEDTFTV